MRNLLATSFHTISSLRQRTCICLECWYDQCDQRTIDQRALCSYNHPRVIKRCVQALSAQFAEGHWRTL
jgi:hypothetical protein